MKGANSETARDINRSLVLRAIRTGQPLSRADVARSTGLQRSTVSRIVEQLINEQWVVEGGLSRLPRGRKPTLLMLNVERAAIIGINVMPSLTQMVLADLSTAFRSQESFPTPRGPAALVTALARRIARWREAFPETTYEAIGVSLPGRVDLHRQKLSFAPNLGWKDADIKAPLEGATGLPVTLENAANACALSETWAGPFVGVQDLIAVAVSEGIGTGIISNGHLVRGAHGAAGEFGHICLDPAGPVCNCGNRGCWEVFASNTAAIRNYNYGIESAPGRLRRKKLEPSASVTNFSDLVTLAARGDDMAREVLDRMGLYLGLGLAILVKGLDPLVISIVGDVTAAWNRIGPIIRRVVAEQICFEVSTRIVPADNNTQPRLRGTVAMVLQKHFQPQMFS